MSKKRNRNREVNLNSEITEAEEKALEKEETASEAAAEETQNPEAGAAENEGADTEAGEQGETESASEEGGDAAAEKAAEKKAKRAERKAKMKNSFVSSFRNKVFRNGTYSSLLIVAALVVVVLVNLLVNALPGSWTAFDISGTLIYDVGEETETAVAELSEDISIKVLATEDNVDTRINTFLEKYAALSKHISIEYIDPVKNPTILTTYDVSQSCIIVECEATGKSEVINFGDIIVQELDYYSYYYYGETVYNETEFDGEGQVTSAILAVSNTNTYKMYTLEGHEENTFGDTISDKLSKLSIETESLNLSTAGAVPEDCDLLVINAAKTDITGDEYLLLSAYMEAGGKLVVITAYTGEEYTNLTKLCGDYGISLLDGYLGDYQYRYSGNASNSYFYLYFPVNGSAEAVSDLTSKYVFVEFAQPLSILSDVRSTVTVTPVLASSDYGFQYTGSADDIVYTKYYMALEATETIDNNEAKLIVFSSEMFIDETMLSYYGSNIANTAVFTNEIASCFEDITNVSIEAKSLELTYNTFSFTEPSALASGIFGLVFAFVLPIVLIIAGLIVWIRRRRK